MPYEAKMDLSFFIKLILLLAVSAVLFFMQSYVLKLYERECLKLWNKTKGEVTASCWLKMKRFAFAVCAVLLIAGTSAVLGFCCGTQGFFPL